MYIFLILLFILYWFFLRPFLKVRRVMNDARRQANDFFGGNSPFGGGQTRSQAPRRPRHRKKIDPDVGEYIDYEEVSTVTTYTYTQTNYPTEEQIEDADWEDIK